MEVVHSIVPPFSKKHQRVPTDLIGPAFAVIILWAILHYGYSFKSVSLNWSPLEIVLLYSVFVPLSTFILCHLGQSQLSLRQVISLTGYALFGHILTLAASLLTDYFFICLIVLGGLSTLRLCLFLLWSMPKPGARLIVCSIVSVVHILFLVFGHFVYMHPTFVYAKGAPSS